MSRVRPILLNRNSMTRFAIYYNTVTDKLFFLDCNIWRRSILRGILHWKGDFELNWWNIISCTYFLVVIFFPLTMRVVVVVLLTLALPGPASELLNVENDVNAFPLDAACANMSSKPCAPKPKELKRDELSAPGWCPRRLWPCSATPMLCRRWPCPWPLSLITEIDS